MVTILVIDGCSESIRVITAHGVNLARQEVLKDITSSSTELVLEEVSQAELDRYAQHISRERRYVRMMWGWDVRDALAELDEIALKVHLPPPGPASFWETHRGHSRRPPRR